MYFNRSETVTLSRGDLYAKVWAKSAVQLAKEFGISDVAIAKLCKKHRVPKPPLGYRHVVTVPPATIAAVDKLLEVVGNWAGDATVRSRAVGSITSIKSVRAGDQLKALTQTGIVGRAGCDAWKALRNASAHGDWRMVKDDLQGTVDRIAKVRVLFFQLVFHLIGYAGKQTDYGNHGWPLVDYPLPVVPATPNPAPN